MLFTPFADMFNFVPISRIFYLRIFASRKSPLRTYFISEMPLKRNGK